MTTADRFLPDRIPDALKQRDNWVCYRAEPYTTDDGEQKTDKIPVNPETGANASSKDPDTWTDFETTVDAAERRDGVDGIGLMFRDGDTLAAVDFDDVRHTDPETGEIEVSEWAGEAIHALDSYTEISPSGTGFHVWVFAFKPGEKCKTEVENGEDIELYDHNDNRFLTVTGERCDEPSHDAEQRNDVFGDLYRQHFGGGSTTLDGYGDDEPEAETIEIDDADREETSQLDAHGYTLAALRLCDPELNALLSSLNPGGHYDSDSEADFAAAIRLAHIEFGDGDIASILRQFRRREKTRDRDDYLELTVSEARKTLSGTATEPVVEHGRGESEKLAFWKLRHAAVAHGVLPPDGFTWQEPDDGGGAYLGFTGSTYNRTLAALDEAGVEHGRERIDPGHAGADRSGSADEDEDEDEDETDDDLPKPDKFRVKNGGYGLMKTVREGTPHEHQIWDRWTSFQIEVVQFLVHAERRATDPTVEATLRVHPADADEDPYEVVVDMTVFNEVRTFRNTVAVGRTTVFDAGTSQLNSIRQFVGAQDAPTRIGVSQLGLYGIEDDHDDGPEWVTPNGVLTADGWTDDPRHTYNGRDTEAARAWALDPDDGDEPDAEAVADALRLIPQTRLADRFLPALGWFYAAPLRPYIIQWEEEFNPLNVLGDTGSGKTTTLQTLMRMFGGSDALLSASGTGFSVMSAFASSNAFPVIFDEYKPADMPDYAVNRFNEHYRKSTRGGVETRGRRDMGTDRYPLRAPVAVAGEQSLRGPAEQRRTILAEFSSRAAAKHSSTREAFARLAGLGYEHGDGRVDHFDGVSLRDHALAYYRFVLALDESDLRDAWRRSEQRVRDVLASMDNGAADDVRDAEFRGLQTVAFGVGTYRAFASEYGADVEADPVGMTDDVLDGALRRLVTRGDETAKHTQRSSHVDRLLGLMARAASAEYLVEGQHYAFVSEGGPDELLGIKLSTAFDATRRYARDHDLRGEDLLDNAGDYRSRLRDAAEQSESIVVDSSKQVYGLRTKGVAIHIGRAMATVPDFDRDMFNPKERDPNKHVGFGVEAEQMATANAAADGGGESESELETEIPDDATGPEADAARVIRELRSMNGDANGWVPRGSIFGRVGLGSDEGKRALKRLRERGDVEENANKYRPI